MQRVAPDKSYSNQHLFSAFSVSANSIIPSDRPCACNNTPE